MKTHTHMTVQQMYRRDETIWDMFTRTGWTMQEIGKTFGMVKSHVQKVLVKCAKRKGEELNIYEDLYE